MTTSNLIKERIQLLEAVNELWKTLLPGAPIPSQQQFDLWLDLHTPESLVKAIKGTARKRNSLNGQMSLEYLVRYCSKAANSAKTYSSGQAMQIQAVRP